MHMRKIYAILYLLTPSICHFFTASWSHPNTFDIPVTFADYEGCDVLYLFTKLPGELTRMLRMAELMVTMETHKVTYTRT